LVHRHGPKRKIVGPELLMKLYRMLFFNVVKTKHGCILLGHFNSWRKVEALAAILNSGGHFKLYWKCCALQISSTSDLQVTASHHSQVITSSTGIPGTHGVCGEDNKYATLIFI